MTTEKAIQLLHRLSDEQFDGIHGDERREALEMAVRALSSQQTDTDSQGLVNDCISRKMAIDVVSKWFYDVFGIKESDGTATIFKRLRELPSAQSQWIPCSERLPEELEEVNVTWVNHDPEPYYNFVKDKPFTATAVYYKEKWYWYSSVCADILAEYGKNDTDEIDGAIEIIAWMPLPEPYGGESE